MITMDVRLPQDVGQSFMLILDFVLNLGVFLALQKVVDGSRSSSQIRPKGRCSLFPVYVDSFG